MGRTAYPLPDRAAWVPADSVDGMDRARPALEQQLVELLARRSSHMHTRATASDSTELDLAHLFDVQLASRHCDLAARWLRSQGKGYYTIGSAGHESNAIVAWRCARPTRRCCTTVAAASTSRRRSGHDAVQRRPRRRGRGDRASRSPAGGTRCSAITTWRSSRRRRRSPRTCRARSAWRSRSTGRAEAAGRRRRGRRDAIAVCSFGDARANHSTAPGAFNTAGYCAHQRPAAAAAVRVRGQRSRHQRAHAGRLDRGRVRDRPAPALRRGRRRRPARSLPTPRRSWPTGCAPSGGRRSCTCAPCATCGHAGTDVESGVPPRRRDPRRLRARPDARHGPRCWSASAGRRRPSSSTGTTTIARGGASWRRRLWPSRRS